MTTMKRRILGLVLLVLLAASPASARLGETEAQLKARFGEPTMRGQHRISAQGKLRELGYLLYFRQEDWSITCTVVDGRCMKISYSKRGDWTEEQIRTVLNSNTQSAAWKEVTRPSVATFRRDWRRSDGSSAVWSKGTGFDLTWSAYDVAKAKLEEQARVEAAKKPRI